MDEAVQMAHEETHWVMHGDTRLHLWEKYRGSGAGKKVVVLAHGSSTGGRESFDLQVPGEPSCSLMDFLAEQGFDVFAPDIRGFGRSSYPGSFLTTDEACEDLNAVVDYVCALRGATQVHLLAWSWGTQYGGRFVMAHPQKVAKYISYAQLHVDSPDLVARRSRLETFKRAPYIRISEQGWKLRFDSMTPPEANLPEVVDAFAAMAAKVQTRSPTGPHIDVLTLLPLVDAAQVSVPVMLIHGQYDDVADLDGLLPFFRQLPHPDKRYVVIPDAGHMMHLQKGHRRFQHEVASFFSAPD